MGEMDKQLDNSIHDDCYHQETWKCISKQRRKWTERTLRKDFTKEVTFRLPFISFFKRQRVHEEKRRKLSFHERDQDL